MEQRITIVLGLFIIVLLLMNINNLICFENFDQKMIVNKSYIETYLDYNKYLYQYIFNKNIPERKKNITNESVTLIDYYKKINSKVKELYGTKSCGFVYTYNKSASLIKGSMYLTEAGISFTYEDMNNNTNLFNTLENNISIVITCGEITHQFEKKQYDVDPITGVITVYIDQNSLQDFFVSNKQYIIYPCVSYEHIDNVILSTGDLSLQQAIVDTNVINSFIVFIGLLFSVLLIYNWKFIYNKISSFFEKKDKDTELSDSMPNNIYYIGGYDYKDYSE